MSTDSPPDQTSTGGEPGSSPRPRPARDPERFLENGRLVRVPRRQADRDDVLALMVTRVLATEEVVTERDLMARLSAVANDPVGLRRALVDARYLDRTRDGAEYWRTS